MYVCVCVEAVSPQSRANRHHLLVVYLEKVRHHLAKQLTVCLNLLIGRGGEGALSDCLDHRLEHGLKHAEHNGLRLVAHGAEHLHPRREEPFNVELAER